MRLSPIYWGDEGLTALLKWEDLKPAKKAALPDIEWLDYKYLFLYAMSENPHYQIPTDCRWPALNAFRWRVDPGKKRQWLGMIRGVATATAMRHPRLDAWVLTRDGGGDPFLDWINEEMDNENAPFYPVLRECLVQHETGIGWGPPDKSGKVRR
jgi:hypothetical protein